MCVLPPQISKPGLQQIRLLQKVQSSIFYFLKQNLYVRFPGSKADLFCDVTPVFGVTPALFCPVGSQYPHAVHNLQKPDLLQDRFESWVVKCTTSLKFRWFRKMLENSLHVVVARFTVARPSATSSHLVHCVISSGNRDLTDLHLTERTAGKFNRAVTHSRPWFQRHHSLFL